MSELVLYSAPATEPVTVDEAKAFLRKEDNDENATIERAIAAAREWVEDYTWRALVTQTWDLYAYEFPCSNGELSLAKGRLQSVSTVTYVDTEGATQTLAGSEYQVDTKREPGRIAPAYSKSWPSTREQFNAVAVRFVAGYGAASAVPAALKQAVLILTADLFENRESEVIGTISAEVRFSAQALLAPFTLWRF